MTIRLYFDEDSMRHALVHALRARGIDVQTALDTAMIERPDEDHLAFATTQRRVLCSFNVADFYRLHTSYMMQHKSHSGIVLARQQQYSVGEYMRSAETDGASDGRRDAEPGGISQCVGRDVR